MQPTPVFLHLPLKKNLREYLAWTDWRVLGLLQEGRGGVHGKIIRTRNHYRVVFQTGDFATPSNLDEVNSLKEKLESKGIQVYIDDAQSSWYKKGVTEEILVTTVSDHLHNKKTEPLSVRSRIVEELQRTPLTRQRVYVPTSSKDKALRIVRAFKREMS